MRLEHLTGFVGDCLRQIEFWAWRAYAGEHDRDDPEFGPFSAYKNLFKLCLCADHGWQHFSPWDSDLTCVNGSVVAALGEHGTSAHEVILRIADSLAVAISGGGVLFVPAAGIPRGGRESYVERNGFLFENIKEKLCPTPLTQKSHSEAEKYAKAMLVRVRNHLPETTPAEVKHLELTMKREYLAVKAMLLARKAERKRIGNLPNKPAGDPRPVVKPAKPKKSTKKGGIKEKIIKALETHHEYENGSCLNYEPIKVRRLARLLGVQASTISDFFKREFAGGEGDGHATYCRACANKTDLIASLKTLNKEFRPSHFLVYGRTPPGERSLRDAQDDE